MGSKETYLVAFDLDKTILAVNSSRTIVQASRRTGMMVQRDFLHAILYAIIYKFDLQDPNKIITAMTKWLRGIREDKLIEMMNLHVVPEVLKTIRPEIREAISMHRENNARIIMLSSAMPYICSPVADHLDLDEVVCSKLEVQDGKMTGKPVGKLVFGKEKAIRMEKYCEENNFSIATSWYYGDAFTDRFVLQSVGNPVCVKPEIKLGIMARRRGWKVI